jgi:lipopolysaccharide/colanic/teichoic acid biosynthesis glycosyltransferase
VRRLFDIAVSVCGLLLLSPLLLVLGLAVRVKLGSPVIFLQDRVGRDGRIFRLYKFRTMTQDRDLSGELLPDAERLTPLGRLLRATSADELPELWNVLRGDMSLVGPRPLLVEYVERYSPEQVRRHEVRPGITGLAQVRGRNSLSWDERLALDVWYVDHRSLLLDLRILLETVGVVLFRRGISHEGEATMPRFDGPVRDPEEPA